MVKVKEKAHIRSDGSIDLEAWLQHLAQKQHFTNLDLIRQACLLSQLAGSDKPTETGESCLQQGLAMAEILADLDLDASTIAAAIIYESVQYADLSLEDVKEYLGANIAKLVEGAARMNSINLLRRQASNNPSHLQMDNLRKMLIAMVDNIQVVLIKLAERIRVLRQAHHLPEHLQRRIAQEAMDIYAPLANRLGIGQIKWEMEDLAFRYLEQEQYKKIAKGLKNKRIERDEFVDHIVKVLTEAVKNMGIHHAKIYGRSKHIFSIFRKMQRKNVDLEKIYDATAVRVLVNTVEECYQVLSYVHEQWTPISAEFDDYIAHPKENGYQSLHTAVRCNDKIFEVQIRTPNMHQQAELGVAAHWLYKEGAAQVASGHERKIAWLRQVLDWQKEISQQDEISEDNVSMLEDRVYVFTPAGEVIDLPQGATPLDFAYHIHTQLGHRCRGAKVDGNIVPLTYQLKTGEQISILSGNQVKPSRDWLNASLGYLHTSRAKAKVLHWFKQLDYEKHRQEGQLLLEKDLRKHDIAIHHINYEKLAHQFEFKLAADFFAAIGRGDLKLTNVIAHLQTQQAPSSPSAPVASPPVISAPSKKISTKDLVIEGMDNLMTRIAQCCKPIPYDPIIGYITQGQGVAVHRTNCFNMLKLSLDKKDRLINVQWNRDIQKTNQSNYAVDIEVIAHDRYGLVTDLSQIFTAEKINILAVNTKTSQSSHTATMRFTVHIPSSELLTKILARIQHIDGVTQVKRVTE